MFRLLKQNVSPIETVGVACWNRRRYARRLLRGLREITRKKGEKELK